MAPSRHIRVFVSSTFRDLQAERDVLVKQTFPQLRALCESRGVTWGEVDLRWGVPDEAVADGRVLGTCLDEIENCRPYFIGLLGGRYGWVPDDLPPDLVQRHPWLSSHRGRSVTELEILHGVLLNAAMHARAFFYFSGTRASSPADEVPDARGRLDELKDRIRLGRDAGVCRLREGFEDATQLGEWVLADFTRLIDRLFPAAEIDPLSRDDAAHLAFAQSRSRVYVPRPDAFAAIDAYVASGSTSPLVVYGAAGTGKSALLANWVLRNADKSPQDRTILHFIGATAGGLSWIDVARRILINLKRDFAMTGTVPDSPGAIASTLADWLRRVPSNTRLIIVIDALNQLLPAPDGGPSIEWLPELPANVRMIVSTIPGTTLDALRQRNGLSFELQPFSADDRRRVITAYLTEASKALDAHRLDRLVADRKLSNARFLVTLIDELRVLGEHERLDQTIDRYLEADSMSALYSRVLDRYETDYDARRGFVAGVFRAIWAARRGLSEAEIREMLGGGDPVPAAEWSPFFLAAASCFIAGDGLINLSNDELRSAIETRYLKTSAEKREAYRAIAAYFAPRARGPRMYEEMPWQFMAAGDWRQLGHWLSDLSFLRDLSIWSEEEVQRYWAALEAHGVSMVGAYRRAIDSPLDPEQRWAVALRLSSAGHRREAGLILRDLASLYERIGDKRNRGHCLISLASLEADAGHPEEAERLRAEAQQLAAAAGDVSLTLLTLFSEAAQLLDRGELPAALHAFERVEQAARDAGNEQTAFKALGQQAVIHHAQGKLALALELQKRVERYAREANDSETLVVSLGNQARILSREGRTEEALEQYQKLATHCREFGLMDALQVTLHNEAAMWVLLDRPDRALSLLEEREALCRRIGHKDRRPAGEVLAMFTKAVRRGGR